jgi:peptidoglycan/LPS O-acetylase OafA/YrhL
MATASEKPMFLSDTLGARFAQRQTGGFDYLRILLSVAVVYVHTWAVTWAGEYQSPEFVRMSARLVLPVFFALSGYLVASSLDRTRNLPIFLGMRFLRIFPALVVETVLSALLLGMLLTTLPLGEYLTHPTFFDYFNNLYGNPRFYLPGVFEANPHKMVNASLWTVPFELECYIALALIYLVRLFDSKWLFLAATIAVSALFAFQLRNVPEGTGIFMPGRVLVIAFLAGNLVYKFRDALPAGLLIAVVTTLIAGALLQNKYTMIPAAFFAAYAAAAWGSTKPWRAPIIFNGDYSYGIYLYAFPIQQLVYQIFESKSIAFNFFASMVVVSFWAAFSWHIVEKPSLTLKKYLQPRPPKPVEAV